MKEFRNIVFHKGNKGSEVKSIKKLKIALLRQKLFKLETHLNQILVRYQIQQQNNNFTRILVSWRQWLVINEIGQFFPCVRFGKVFKFIRNNQIKRQSLLQHKIKLANIWRPGYLLKVGDQNQQVKFYLALRSKNQFDQLLCWYLKYINKNYTYKHQQKSKKNKKINKQTLIACYHIVNTLKFILNQIFSQKFFHFLLFILIQVYLVCIDIGELKNIQKLNKKIYQSINKSVGQSTSHANQIKFK
ncbi:transmembrane protein, putative (macronuclear) [Tetrahymena thermophila SB210]|uniref:Transmembrane protein, putative n=1 Tax=Tetrahymena thermophila (strain SB210) TaxID=312017 RepID=I7MA63_TETTS|nr:transmembrane protein, putative [Tetrahymena thermophila SB210]EAS03789.2 transmembrane protein, putative [Tetrahymena thermophila SB210]|eukprot:XP_001024034.2 transmembrane protein, putative [Tetrahymena thermophila SB210]